MAKTSNANIDNAQFAEQAGDAATPASGYWRLFFKADGLYAIDDAGTVIGPFSTFDPATEFDYYNDFIGTDHSLDDAWVTGVSAGSVTHGSEARHPGTIALATSTNNAGYAISSLAPLAGNIFNNEYLFFGPTGTDELNFEACFKVNELFNASPNPGVYRLGFIDDVGSYNSHAALFLSSGAQDIAVKDSGGSTTSQALAGSPITANTWHRVRLTLTASHFLCYVDGVLVATISDTSNFPDLGMTAFLFVQNGGGTGVNHILTVDYVRVWGTVTRN